MTNANKPLNKVIPQYTQAEAQVRTDNFIAPDGAWTRLVNAKNNLVFMVEDYLESTESPYPGMSKEHIADLLVGHCGLRGEYGNSVETMIGMLLKENWMDEPLDARLEQVVASFDKRSELTKESGVGPALATERGGLELDAQGQPAEIKSQALHRCALDVERWLQHNQDRLPKGRADYIAENLDDYRTALAEVEEYLAYSRDYMAQRMETRLQKNNDRQV